MNVFLKKLSTFNFQLSTFYYLCTAIHAQMVELVDTRDLKSLGQ